MHHIIENDALRLSVNSLGAQAVSLVCKRTGRQMLWCGDPSVWNRHAPLLFPYTGRLTGGRFVAEDGLVYAGKPHGFAQDMTFSPVMQTADALSFRLEHGEQTHALFPYPFTLDVVYTLRGHTLLHTARVKNPGGACLRFGLGFHPGFAIPFDDAHTYADYDLVFDRPQSPLCIGTLPHGLLGESPNYYLARNADRIPLTATLFANDSHCMTGLTAKTLSIVERDTGRRISVCIEGFPFVLLWSAKVLPMRFVCIEPWHSLPGEAAGPQAWAQKPCAACLAPGETFETTLSVTFER